MSHSEIDHLYILMHYILCRPQELLQIPHIIVCVEKLVCSTQLKSQSKLPVKMASIGNFMYLYC